MAIGLTSHAVPDRVLRSYRPRRLKSSSSFPLHLCLRTLSWPAPEIALSGVGAASPGS